MLVARWGKSVASGRAPPAVTASKYTLVYGLGLYTNQAPAL